VILRAALLVVGGAFMLWKAHAARGAARAPGGLGADETVLLSRVALVETLVGVLALAAAALALLALRARRPTRTLKLQDLEPSVKTADRPGPGDDVRPPL
jgi:hypothetical protein